MFQAEPSASDEANALAPAWRVTNYVLKYKDKKQQEQQERMHASGSGV